MHINRLDIKDDRQLRRRGNGEEVNLILSDRELEREVGSGSGGEEVEMYGEYSGIKLPKCNL